MKPINALALVRQLAADEDSCEFFAPVFEELRRRGLDSDDLREIIISEIGDVHCFDSQTTRKHYPGTTSDYYSIWVDVCGCRMFLKLLVSADRHGTERLVITSFKKDVRHDP
ncbi:hypothetical protein KHP60_09500 [Microvirga sp. 3-52]|uniref:hypothetical protein n=1 Tax=Microvirga sp. 3-52 TaxID=2792425 RepID=UPI001AC479CD|nr:hypothetical protein [Microvirga sp. 3-52]MBO1905341.1 hypothetical protein [Microvirga sp. 3-52]MBS7452570.1 hypothetical protein [Microvirga sp. 3-52]